MPPGCAYTLALNSGMDLDILPETPLGSLRGLVVFQIEAESGWYNVLAGLVTDNACMEVGG